MSFPRLVLTGSVSGRYIDTISVAYDNDTVTDKPALITRSKYDIKRETRLRNAAGGIKQQYPQQPYDQVRLVHRWTGYIDVLTESVSYTDVSSDEDKETIALIKTAVMLNLTGGVEHTIASFDSGDLGPNKPSLAGIYYPAADSGEAWTYLIEKVSDDPPVYEEAETVLWFIRDINISDRQNNTSRVTFELEIVEAWVDLEALIEAIPDPI